MRIFKSKWFERFARKEGLGDNLLKDAVSRVYLGQIDADLGGGVFKQRLARVGEGRSRGYRIVLFYRRDERAFLMYGFAKSRLDNITRDDQKQLKESAKYVLSLTERQLDALIEKGDFMEVKT